MSEVPLHVIDAVSFEGNLRSCPSLIKQLYLIKLRSQAPASTQWILDFLKMTSRIDNIWHCNA